MTEADTLNSASPGPRVVPKTAGWVEDLPLRESPLSGKPDGWDELNHLDEIYLEFSMASDIPRGLILVGGIACVVAVLIPVYIVVSSALHKGNLDFDVTAWILVAAVILGLAHAVFLLRFDLRLPKDRPIRFNRKQGKVYANYYTWNHNPFGRWGGGVKVFDWNTLQAQITKQIGASGEVITQRYALELVSCKPGTFEAVEHFRLQQGAQTTGQYEEIWALLRHYMACGLDGLPPQGIRDMNPGFIDCLLFAMPWFAPTEAGRRSRVRMKGFWGRLMMVLMSVPFPLWLLFGIGNFIVMRLAPEASWPPGVDEQSRQ
jgi:hypothetical protein